MTITLKTTQPQASMARRICPECVSVSEDFSSIQIKNASMFLGSIFVERSRVSELPIFSNLDSLRKSRRLKTLSILEKMIIEAQNTSSTR